jgi:hypothetical protein
MRVVQILSLVILATTLFITGCSPTKGYEGPDRPVEELALIKSESDPRIDIAETLIDYKAMNTQGIYVLPGNHRYSLSVLTNGDIEHCRILSRYDHSAYDSCIQRQDATSCSCYDFMEISKECFRRVYDYSCSGEFSVEAGRRYIIHTATFRGTHAEAYVTEEGAKLQLGRAHCLFDGDRAKPEREILGKGRSLARVNGVYSCETRQ